MANRRIRPIQEMQQASASALGIRSSCGLMACPRLLFFGGCEKHKNYQASCCAARQRMATARKARVADIAKAAPDFRLHPRSFLLAVNSILLTSPQPRDPRSSSLSSRIGVSCVFSPPRHARRVRETRRVVASDSLRS